MASENIRCNLAFFPNVTHKCRAGHASTFKVRQIPLKEGKHAHAYVTAQSFCISVILRMYYLNIDIFRLSLFSVSYNGIVPCFVDIIM